MLPWISCERLSALVANKAIVARLDDICNVLAIFMAVALVEADGASTSVSLIRTFPIRGPTEARAKPTRFTPAYGLVLPLHFSAEWSKLNRWCR